MNDKTKKLFDAPWKIEQNMDVFELYNCKDLCSFACTDEKNAHRFVRLPELYDALKGAVQEACGTCAMMHVNSDTYDFVEKGCPFIGEHHCDYRDCIAILRKVRDGK